MGLDTVELVMAIEKEFAITITDHEAAQILTVGQLCEHIQLRLVSQQGLAVASRETISRKVTQILSHEFGIRPENIQMNSRFIDDLGLD